MPNVEERLAAKKKNIQNVLANSLPPPAQVAHPAIQRRNRSAFRPRNRMAGTLSPRSSSRGTFPSRLPVLWDRLTLARPGSTRRRRPTPSSILARRGCKSNEPVNICCRVPPPTETMSSQKQFICNTP